MPDVDALAGEIGAQLAALVRPMFARLEANFEQRLEAVSLRGADITPAGELVLMFGDGSSRNLGRVVGVDGLDGLPGVDAPAVPVEALTARLCAVEAASLASATIDDEGGLVLRLVDGTARSVGQVRGRDGEPGRPGADAPAAPVEALAERVRAVEANAIANALIGRDGGLVLVKADGSSLDVGPVVGRDGENGQDGQPGAAGLGFEDIDVALGEDGRTIRLSFERGDLAQTFELELPTMLYRGVYEAGREYRPGDAVSFGGSTWVCHTPTSNRPGEGDGWTLAVKRGRDGKDFAGPAMPPKPKAVA